MQLESQYESLSNRKSYFYRIEYIKSQYFPQCVKYLFSDLVQYWLVCKVGIQECKLYNLMCSNLEVKEGFVSINATFVKFDLNYVLECNPEELEIFVKYGTTGLCDKQKFLLLIVLKDRWYKGDFDRIKKILNMNNYGKLTAFVENCLWERGYEDNYTLGQQLSIRMTTNLIQSGLDFKHHVSDEKKSKGRAWNDASFEKMLCCIRSVADVTKRYKWSQIYIVIELDRNNLECIKCMLQNNFNLITNKLIDNVCLLNCTKEKQSVTTLNKLTPIIKSRHINILFVTDTENYIDNHVFYIYNSMKFYYYCLKNRFVFEYSDYETLYLLYTIVVIEILNGGCLNSFTLEKSPIMHPLELNSRRCNALKRAAAQNKMVCNDMELKVDFVKGKRITTGTHNPNRLVEIKERDIVQNLHHK